MMEKYILCIKNDKYSVNDRGASSKAPADILKLAEEAGYKELVVHDSFPGNKLLGYICFMVKAFGLSLKLKDKCTILFQYPFVNVKLIPLALKMFKRHHLLGLIHDINSVRVSGNLSDDERKALSGFNEIYAHTENMKTYLAERLPQSVTYQVLDCFPYFAGKNKVERHLSKAVCFAGNLNKSKFLPQLVQENKGLEILLYGSIDNPEKFGNKAQYLGSFRPNEIENIRGSWGLVWDGERTDCCGGNYGEYLKIIAPHKFSMYLASEMPVIVWKKSAMSALVEKYGLGITVFSLADISEKIEAFSEEDYQSVIRNVRAYLNGKMNIVF